MTKSFITAIILGLTLNQAECFTASDNLQESLDSNLSWTNDTFRSARASSNLTELHDILSDEDSQSFIIETESHGLSDGSSEPVTAKKEILNPKQVVELAAQNPLLLPIPDYVMNDTVRAFEPTEESIHLTLSNGEVHNLIFSGVELLDQQKKVVSDFEDWLDSQDLTIPSVFRESDDNDIYRFLIAS